MGQNLGRSVRTLCTLALLFGVVIPLSGPTPAHAQQQPVSPVPSPTPPRVDQGLVRQLGQESNGQVTIEYHRETGMVRFVGTGPGQPIARAAAVPVTASPVDAARGFMATYGPLFGVQDQARELTVKREKPDTGGRSIVRFAQQHKGIPVFVGEVAVNLDRLKNVQAAAGELLPDIDVDTSPTVSRGDAREAALAAVARDEQLETGRLSAGEPALWIYNRALVGDPGPQITQLVWRLDVTAGQADPIRYLVLVDAHSGVIALKFNQIADARNRQTFDMNHSTTTGTLVCNESNPTCTGQIQDAVDAHVYAGHTYDFYQAKHGRDSLNGAGMTIKSFVRYSTGYRNAFWDGAEMVYGDGFSHADDVVAHELTHGVTQFESGLLYFRQSGAINESFSDIWGEFVDLTNNAGNDGAGVRWQLAEDLTGFGPIRNMANPPAFNDPDRVTSALWWGAVTDNGGVHTNSGVNNKAAFLLTDGGTFNGKTVTALGIDKTAKIYYEAQTNLLTPGSDYADLYTALQQACSTLVGTGVTTVADCQEVLDAIQAVEMHLVPTVGAAVQAPVCPSGQSPVNVFFDDLENVATTNGSFASSILSGSGNGWSYPQPAQYTNTTSGTKNFHALDRNTTGSYAMARTADVTLPANAFLRFNHTWRFDTQDLSGSSARFWDGAILEYSTNSGGSWSNAASLFTDGGYTGTLATAAEGSANPLAGQNAWVGNSDYGSARVNLSSLAGQPFRFRFRVGTDGANGADGWFIDDVRIYTCGAGPAAGVTVTPTGGLTTTEAGGTATFTVQLTTAPTANVTIGLSSSDASEGRISQLSLLFTPQNALLPQTVTVTGLDDAIADGTVSYTIVTAPAESTDASYSGVNPPDVSVSNTDDEVPPGITVSPTSGLTTTEAGGTATFTVVLMSVPTANVTISLSSSDITEGTVSPTSLTFTSGNALTPQTVTVTGVSDGVDDGDVAYTIVTDAATTTDLAYSGLNADDVAVTNTDDDTFGIAVAPTSGLTTTEAGGTATFTVVLNSVPIANVAIGLSSSDVTEGTVSPTSLTFTPANALTSQTVTVTGVDDGVDDGNVAYSIVTAPASSTDPQYNTLNPADVSVTNTDNDDPPVGPLLTVATVGSGTVTGPGISCGSDCSESYANGTQVTLSAQPAVGWAFAGWGGACAGMSSCQVTVNGPTNVTATFLRANVGVSVYHAPGSLPNGDRILAATLTARAGCGSIDRVQFGTLGAPFQNARVAVTSPAGGPVGQLLGFTYTAPPSTTAVTITIERVVPSGEGMVNPIYFYDGCGEWRTFAGGGPEAFR